MAKGKAKSRATAGDEPATEYERRRRERIRENQARLEALGLPSLASPLRTSAPEKRNDGDKSRKRRSSDDADEEYMPSDDGPSSRGESEDEEERRDCGGKGSASGAKQRSNQKGKSRNNQIEGRARKKLFDEGFNEEFNAHDEDTSLAQAIALSLGEPLNSNASPSIHFQKSLKSAPRNDIGGKGNVLANSGRGKRKKEARAQRPSSRRSLGCCCSFWCYTFRAESGKGGIILQDLQRMAIAHDFCWSDKEMADMIYLFDIDGDGKLNFNDFHKIISKCNMLVQADPCGSHQSRHQNSVVALR